jgi:hypothetical protein
MPVRIEPAPPPQPPPGQRERDALATAIAVLQQACTEAERAGQPVARLEQAVRRVVEIEAGLKSQLQAYQAKLSDWIVDGCEGPRPEPAPETLAAERELSIVVADAAAAREALPALTATLSEANERVRAAHHRRDEAAYLCALAIARGRCATLRARINSVLEVEAELRSIADELTRLGNRGGEVGHVAMSAGVEIRELILHTKRDAGLPPNLLAGPRLLQRLMTDAQADFHGDQS